MSSGHQTTADTGTDTTRLDAAELGAFLRSRRARVTPADVGLPDGARRRTPGLRREEVAQLAGISATWYTWLEQGRPINVSEQVLEAVARTLRLDRHERAHLATLAGASLPTGAEEHAVDAATLRVVHAVEPWPACVQNARFDVLAWNRGYGRLIGDLDRVPPLDRNSVWLMFTDPDWQVALVDRDQLARQSVARLRSRWPEHRDDAAWRAFVERLRAASEEFARLWDSRDVTEAVTERKQVLNSAVGRLDFELATSWLSPAIGTRLVVFTPADDDTERRLRDLLA